MDQLYYSFLSLAKVKSTSSGNSIPLEGMKLIGALAHKYSIPVTWIVDSQSAEKSREFLLKGHQEYDDDIVLAIDISRFFHESGTNPKSKAEEIVILRQELPDFIKSEREKIREILPWTKANIIATDRKSETLIEILEESDCIGLWGYNWSEGGDLGCPWSFFYPSKNHYNLPSQSSDGIVAVESTSLDLNAVFHSGNPEVFSPYPKSLKMSGLYKAEGISYPKTLIREYLKNRSWNRFIIFVQQQPAYQMEYDNYESYAKGTISELSDILAEFFYEILWNPDIQAVSLRQAIQSYKDRFNYTENCCMVFDGIVSLNMDINFYVPPVPKQKPPYPLSFFYYDRECLMVFEEGKMMPVEMRNYLNPPFDSKGYVEREIPSISSFHPARDRDKLILEFEIESVKQMPFGLVIWDDHSLFSLVSTNAKMVKWIGNYLLFVRLDLEEGLNRLQVSLTI
jgi:hypothetical protein